MFFGGECGVGKRKSFEDLQQFAKKTRSLCRSIIQRNFSFQKNLCITEGRLWESWNIHLRIQEQDWETLLLRQLPKSPMASIYSKSECIHNDIRICGQIARNSMRFLGVWCWKLPCFPAQELPHPHRGPFFSTLKAQA